MDAWIWQVWICIIFFLIQTTDSNNSEERIESCESARLKCAYRVGCGSALQNYFVGCSMVLSTNDEPHTSNNVAKRCPEPCQLALIALTSTDEGKHLMNCRCGDDWCEQTKRRIEVCRPEVIEATRNESVVSCRVAEWICAADPLCSTALDYYNRFCKQMFHGKKCSHRCNNSLAILLRQEKAAKLINCECDGREDYNCAIIRDNMNKLCLKAKSNNTTTSNNNIQSNDIPTSSAIIINKLSLLLFITILFFHTIITR